MFRSLLQITDNIEWSQAALDTVLTKCQIEIEINIELWVNVSGSLIPNPAIIDNICPGSCSGNGNCVEGKTKYISSKKNVVLLSLEM